MTENLHPIHETPPSEAARLAASAAVSASVEIPRHNEGQSAELHTKIGDYFDTHMTTPYAVITHEAESDVRQHRDIFTQTAAELFGARSIEQGGGHNPRLAELVNILASVDHNAGVYYEKDDVAGVFTAIAHELFDDPTVKQQLGGDTVRPKKVIQARAEEVTSINAERSLPLIKDESGQWRTVGDQEYSGVDDFKPLEVLRQDNADKGGYNKYRFRQPTYTRTPDTIHAKQTREGWYTSDWYQDPNYWSAQIREALVSTAASVNEQLAGTNASAMFVTEGGVFKGTATEWTDVDTNCWISCESPDLFEDAYQKVSPQLTECLDSLPFKTKRGKGSDIWPTFFDRTTGREYYRKDNGEFAVLKDNGIVDGKFVTQLRRHEKGLMVTTADGATLFRRPDSDSKDVGTYVSISPDGVVQKVAEPVVQPRATASRVDSDNAQLDLL